MSVVTMERRNIERIPKFIVSDCYWILCSQDSTLGTASGLRAGRSGVRILVGVGDFFSYSRLPDRLWGPPAFCSVGTEG